MNLQDRFFELLLAAFDRFMDFATFGKWSQAHGDVVPNIKVKES
jgi:hypothetical protein